MSSEASAVLEVYEEHNGDLDSKNLENGATNDNFQKEWKNELSLKRQI